MVFPPLLLEDVPTHQNMLHTRLNSVHGRIGMLLTWHKQSMQMRGPLWNFVPLQLEGMHRLLTVAVRNASSPESCYNSSLKGGFCHVLITKGTIRFNIE